MTLRQTDEHIKTLLTKATSAKIERKSLIFLIKQKLYQNKNAYFAIKFIKIHQPILLY